MKKLILIASAVLFSVGAANAQGYSPTGTHDDFVGATVYPGLYYWAYDGTNANGANLVITRPDDGTMVLTANAVGGAGKYPYLACEFANQTIDLSGNANIIVDIENMNDIAPTFFAIELEDENAVVAKIEPNVSDVLITSTYGDNGPPTNHYRRKALIGFELVAEERRTFTLDLNNGGTNRGGLTATASTCSGIPYDCPETAYNIDITKIKVVRFLMNFGSSNLDLMEGFGITEGDATWDAAIVGGSIAAFTGAIKIHDLKIGTWTDTDNITDATAANSLKVYPNPADAELNISFDANSNSSVKLVDMLGNEVYSAAGTAGANNISVNTSDLNSGLYILNVTTEQGNVSRKVTIK